MKKILRNILILLALVLISCGKEEAKKDEFKAALASSEPDLRVIAQVRSATFSGPDIAWFSTVTGDLLRTEDAGGSWETIPGKAVGGFDKLSFIDHNNGWTLHTQGPLWRTGDGGRTWSKIIDLRQKYPSIGPFVQMEFVDNLHGWVLEPFAIWRTEDGGSNWQQYVPSSAPNLIKEATYRFYFLDKLIGWLGGQNGAVYYTKEGGKTWESTRIDTEEKPYDFDNVFFLDELTGWVNGFRGGFFRTDDGGKSWRYLPFRLPGDNWAIRSVYFINKNEGWAVGNDSDTNIKDNSGGIVLRTLDGGQSWQLVQMEKGELFYDRVYFPDAQHGWLFSRDNVYRTDDGGQTWRIVLRFPPTEKPFSKTN
jgi:photosystem II stability/assembly factor-like uncharacterized protein